MKEESAIDWAELTRRHADGDHDYIVTETIRAGVKVARSLQHPLIRYHASDTINGRQYDAGMKLLEDFTASKGLYSSMQYDGTPIPQSFSSGGVSDRMIEASKAYDNALRAVGVRASLVLTDIVIAEATLEWHGARVKQSRMEAMGSLKMVLDMLGDHYKMGR